MTPGETLTIRIGKGDATWTELFWARKNVFDNPGSGTKGVGDGAFLFDPQGDLRAWMTYPCRLACTDPYAGALQLSADAKGAESVTVRNVGTATVDLDGYRLTSPPYVYAFGIGTTLARGEELTVDTRGDPDEDTRLEKHWGRADADPQRRPRRRAIEQPARRADRLRRDRHRRLLVLLEHLGGDREGGVRRGHAAVDRGVQEDLLDLVAV